MSEFQSKVSFVRNSIDLATAKLSSSKYAKAVRTIPSAGSSAKSPGQDAKTADVDVLDRSSMIVICARGLLLGMGWMLGECDPLCVFKDPTGLCTSIAAVRSHGIEIGSLRVAVRVPLSEFERDSKMERVRKWLIAKTRIGKQKTLVCTRKSLSHTTNSLQITCKQSITRNRRRTNSIN